MRHRSVLSFLLPALLCVVVLRLPAQQSGSEEEKRRAFLKAREEMTTIPYTPSGEPAPKPKPHATPAGERPPVRTTPVPVVRPTPEATPRPTPIPVPVATPPPPRPNIVVRESAVGVADEEREPTPKPPGMWARLFGGGGGGGGTSYRYLTGAVRREIDRAPVARGRWRYIVVHNSGTRQGNAAAFEHYHRNVRHMVNGLAYHFVIGNGTSTRDGAIEIGNRWHRQMQGGHVHSDYLNNIGIGVCLVGDFNVQRVGEGQKAALTELITYLRHRVGKIQGHTAEVRAHKHINPPQWPTDCPGNLFPYDWLARKF